LEYLKTVLNTFPIDTESTKRIIIPTQDENTRLYAVDVEKSPFLRRVRGRIYIIDTPAGQRMACHPHLVADELSKHCVEAAEELGKALHSLGLVSERSAILHILRGSVGYRVNRVLSGLPVINIRTKYTEEGYRAHSDGSKRINVVYSDYAASEHDTLIIPDTYATGRSAETALCYMFDKGLRMKRVLLYGFTAAPAIERVYRVLSRHKVELVVFAICDISQLCWNKYDMPLYGVDESLYRERGEIKPMGSVVSLETLRDMIPRYVPGMDQPGDWSERHSRLYNGLGEEPGNIREHLKRSIELIEALNAVNMQQPWYNENIREITRRELENLREALSRLNR